MAKKPNAAASNVDEGTFAEGYSAYLHDLRGKDEAVAKLRNTLKRCEVMGIPIKAMQVAEKMRRKGSDACEQEAKDLARMARWMGLAMFTQGILFDGVPVPVEPVSMEVQRHQAHASGYESGIAGGDRNGDNPHNPGDELHVAFDSGYMDGQMALAEGLGPKVKKASTEKRKPGRPRKAAVAGFIPDSELTH